VRLVVACLVAVAAVGCRHDDGDAPQRYEIIMRGSAADAARESGVDLRGLVARSADHALSLLPRGAPVEIEVKVGGDYVIPEIGYGGVVRDRDAVEIQVERPLREGAERWVPALVAHELHHVSRLRSRPIGGTLADALVSEGLADHFAEEAFPATPPKSWNEALAAADEDALWRRARPILRRRDGYDHGAWFFGRGDLLRYAGYRLGYGIVGAYLAGGLTAADAAEVDADDVIDAYERGRP
jgi:hypothetical protein